jgi:hypothetical protein
MPIPSPYTYPLPQPVGGVVTFDDAIGQDVTYDIYTRTRWADAWTLDATLDLLSISWAVAPTEPTAVIRYRYGRVLEIGASVETTRAKKSMQGVYIKIIVHCADGDRPWHGFVQDVADEQYGIVRRDVSNVDATGVQTFACVGMIAALDRAPIARTYFNCSNPFSRSGSDGYRAAWSAPLFNVLPSKKNATDEAGAKIKLPPLRGLNTSSVPSFTGASVPTANTRATFLHWFNQVYNLNASPNKWTLKQTLEYLAAYCGPRVGVETDLGPFNDSKTEFVPIWIFDAVNLPTPNNVTQYPQWYEPTLDCEGLTLKGALDRLLSREAGLGYTVFVDETETPNRVYVEPFTTITADATLIDDAGNNQVFPRNRRIVNIVCATDAATSLSSQTVGQTAYTAVQVAGAPIVAVCTLTVSTHLQNGWSSALAAELAADIAALTTPAGLRRTNAIRDISTQPKYRTVNRSYSIDRVWDFRLQSPARDVFRDFGYPSGQQRYLPFPARLRILDKLPLRAGVDYAQTTVATIRAEHNAATGKNRDAEVYARSHAPATNPPTLTGPFCCWSTRAHRDILVDLNDANYQIVINEIANGLLAGIELDVVNAYQGVFGTIGQREAPHQPKIDPEILQLTVAMQSDRRFSVVKRNPTSVSGSAALVDADRIKVFDLGDRLQYVEVLKDTVVGINTATDTLRTVPVDYVLRDDTNVATLIADFLATYYFSPRNVIRINSRRATARLWPGQILGTCNAGTPHAITANSLVSEVSIAFGVGLNGEPTKPAMTVQSSFGELDPLQFFPSLSSGQ